jgi:histidine ammonia-lyase
LSYERIRAGRQALCQAVADGAVVYGMTTGVGALKICAYGAPDQVTFGRTMALAHDVAVGCPVEPGLARLALWVRLNTLVAGRVGVTEGFVRHLWGLLAHDVLPCISKGGSVGCGDLAQMGQLASLMVGEGNALWQGRIVPARDALAGAALSPYTMEPREGLAAVASNAFGVASCAAAVARVRRCWWQILDQMAVLMPAWGLDPRVWHAALTSNVAAERAIARWLLDMAAEEGSVLAAPNVHDPLSGRFIVQTLAACHQAIEEASAAMLDATAQVDDNPVLLDDGRVVPSGGSHHAFLSLRLNGLQTALAMLARNLVNHCLALTNGALPGLTINLVPPGRVGTGYGPVMKAAMEQSVRVAALAAPIGPLVGTLATGLEDEALLLPLVSERLGEQAEALSWLTTIALATSVRAIELRGAAVGARARATMERVERRIPPGCQDRPLSSALAAVRADWWALRTAEGRAPWASA